MKGKYTCERDARLHALCLAEWANSSDGDVQAPTGYFWCISNYEADLDGLMDVLEGVLTYQERAELVGHFLVVEDSYGFVSVQKYPSASALASDYALASEQFAAAWGESE